MSREIKAKAWNGESFYSPVLYDGKVFRDARAFEDFIPCDDPVVWYTGLKDKNGVEIYEGDIVKWTHSKHWWIAVIEPIEMCPNGPLYAVERTNNMSVNDDEQYTYELTHSRMGARNELPFLSKSTEVIGNIYETPELLEDK